MISPEHVVKYLRETTDIADAVGKAEYRGVDILPIVSEISRPVSELMPRRAILVTSAGGPASVSRNDDMVQGRMDVRCYGRNVGDAWALHDKVFNHFRHGGKRSMNGLQVFTFRPSAGGHQDRQREGGWPYVWMEYVIIMNYGGE